MEMTMTKRNPVARSLHSRQFHQRIVVSKKLYVRSKEKERHHAENTIQQGDHRGE